MKIFLFGDYYKQYLDSFYDRHNIEGMSYNEHMEFLLGDYMGSFGSYRNHFREIGHDAQLIKGNKLS